jgi:hypothetical protein
MSEVGTGFAEPVVDLDEPVVGGEGDSPAPRTVFERSPLKVLASLEGKPFQQAVKAIEYIDAGKERQRKFLKACSPQALDLIAYNGPEYLEVVTAVRA